MAASLVGQLALAVKGDLDRFRSDLRSQAPRIGDEVGTTLGARIKARLSAANIGTAVGATLGGLGIGALKLADDYKAAVDAIRVGTGATGEALDGPGGQLRARRRAGARGHRLARPRSWPPSTPGSGSPATTSRA